MVDTKKIEELRALAFASIPATARKGQQAVGVVSKGKSKRRREEKEDGEVSSDEENAVAVANSWSRTTFGQPLEAISSLTTAQTGNPCTDFESCPAVGANAPVSAGVECRPHGSKVSEQTSTAVKIRDTRFVPQRIYNAPASLPSRTALSLLQVGKMRKDAEALSTSMKVPGATSSSHLPGFIGERNSSLVIKFSDEDSDSEAENQPAVIGQGNNASENRKSVDNGLPNATGTNSHQLNLSNQTTGGLKSEIDRVKKQIAAIEQRKGKSGASMASDRYLKSSTMSAPRQASSKCGQFSTSANPGVVELESLRQQIAAKESELQLRKQRGLRELVCAGIVPSTNHSSAALGSGQATDSNLSCLEESTSYSILEGMHEVLTAAPLATVSQINAPSHTKDVSYTKNGPMDTLKLFGSAEQQESQTISDRAASKINSREDVPLAGSTGSAAWPLGSSDPVGSGKIQIPLWSSDQKNTSAVIDDAVKIMYHTPKRKRNESETSNNTQVETGSERVKKQKRENSFLQLRHTDISEKNLRPNASQEIQKVVPVTFLAKENETFSSGFHASIEQQSLLCSNNTGISECAQAITTAASTLADSHKDLCVQEEGRETLVNGDTHKHAFDAVAPQPPGSDIAEPKHPNLSHEIILGANDICVISQNSKPEHVDALDGRSSSGQFQKVSWTAEPTSQGNGILHDIDAFKERQSCSDVAILISSPSSAFVGKQADTVRLADSEKGLQGIQAVPNSLCSSHQVCPFGMQQQNPCLAVLQGLSGQGCEIGCDSLKQLKDEEDLVDKELEEAQQNRHKCEVRERLARRQYQDAQEELQSANFRCEILYQKREMLAVRIKAAQIQYHQSKASLLPPVQQEGTLVPVGFPKYSGTPSFSYGTSVWARKDQKVLSQTLDHRISQGNAGSEPGSAMVMDLTENLQRCSQSDGKVNAAFPMISKFHQAASNSGANGRQLHSDNPDLCNRGAVVMAPSLHEINPLETAIILPFKDGFVRHHREWVEPDLREISRTPVLAQQDAPQGEPWQQAIIVPPVVCKSDAESGGLKTSNVAPLIKEGVDFPAVDKSNPSCSSSKLVGAAYGHGLERECCHGFSSASFAMDLDRNTNHNLKGSNDAVSYDRIHKSGIEVESFVQSASVLTLQASLDNYETTIKNKSKDAHGSLKENDLGTHEGSVTSSMANTHREHGNQNDKGLSEAALAAEEREALNLNQEVDVFKPLAIGASDASIMEENRERPVGAERKLQDRVITAKFCRGDSRFGNSNILSEEAAAKGILVTSMKGLLGKETGGQQDSPGVQLEGPDDLQEVATLDRLGILEGLDVKPLGKECLKTPVANNSQLSAVPKGVLHDEQSSSADNAEIGKYALISGAYLVSNKAGQLGRKEAEIAASMVPSTKLKLLFRHYEKPKFCEHTVDTEKIQDCKLLMDQNLFVMPSRYESPLCIFRSFRGRSQSADMFHFSTSSHTWTHKLDPYKVLCKYEHRGKCNNDDCTWQHKRDYVVSPNQVLDELHRYAEVRTVTNGRDGTERADTNMICTIPPELSDSNILNKERETGGTAVGSPIDLHKEAPLKWNMHVTDIPIYRIGSYLVKADCVSSPLSLNVHKQRLAFGPLFSVSLPVLRQLPIDMPCLLETSSKLPNLGDGLASSRLLTVGNRSQVEFEGHCTDSLEDMESLLVVALNLIDFNVDAEKSEARKNVLYVLSRGLEAKPSSAVLWVVYLHLFYRWETRIGKDDLFHHAVQHNQESYELWMMFIKSRRHLAERLEAYKSAIVALGGVVKNQGLHLAERSSLVLDLVLQMLNFLCVSQSIQQAVDWIDDLIYLTSENTPGLNGCNIKNSSTVLTCLTKHDICIMWICCASVILYSQLPIIFIERLGCKQQLPIFDIWHDKIIRKSDRAHAMRLMHVAASHGKGCLALDSVTSLLDNDTRLPKEVMAVNFVQCAAVCEGLDSSVILADKFLKLYPSSLELILLRVNLEERCKDKMAGLNIFEEAILQWPVQRPGKVRLWNQYVGYAFEAKGADFVKFLLARCAAQIQDSSNTLSALGEALGSFYPPSSGKKLEHNQMDLNLPKQGLDDCIRQAFQFLSRRLKQQLVMESGTYKQVFCNQDGVFGFLNLALLEALSGDILAAKSALDSGIKIAADSCDVQHCLTEMAALTFFGSVNSTHLTPNLLQHEMLSLIDRCFVEAQLLTTVHPLSKGFCERIKNRRVRAFVEYLFGPWPTDNSMLNNILETIYGPTLLPKENLTMKELIDFVEKLMNVMPSNVRLAASACRAIQSRIDDFNEVARPAVLFWSTSVFLNSLCQSSPEASEPLWVEAGSMIELLGMDSLLEGFYQHALAVYPFSTALWHRVLAVSSRTGHLKLAVESALEHGVMIDVQSRG